MKSAETRRLYTLLMLIFCYIITFQPVVLSGTTYWDIAPSWSFYSGDASNSGPISFSSSFTASTLQITNDQVRFTDLNMGTSWSQLGFHAPQDATLQLSSANSENVSVLVDPNGVSKTFEVWIGSKSTPEEVYGVDSWSYASQTVSFTTDQTETIKLSWTTTSPPAVGPSPSTTNLIDVWLEGGDVSGFIIAIYTSEMGSMFFLFVGIIISLPIFMVFGAIPTAIIWILFWGTLDIALPAIALDIGIIMLGLGIGFLIFSLYMGRRGLG